MFVVLRFWLFEIDIFFLLEHATEPFLCGIQLLLLLIFSFLLSLIDFE